MAGYLSYYNEKYANMAGSWDGGSTGVLYTERRDMFLDPYEMASLFPSVTPFLAFSSEQPIRVTDDPDFKVFEEDDTFVNQQFDINAAGTWSGATAGSTVTVAVDNFVALAEGTNLEGLEVEVVDTDGTTTNAIALITNYNAGTNEVTLKALKASPVALAGGDTAYVIGNARAEGSRSPEAWSTQPRVVWNSAQIEKTPIEITGTLYKMAKLRATKLNELTRLQQNKAREHLIQRERKLLFGYRVNGNDAPTGHFTDSDGQPIRTTMGIIPMFDDYGITSGSSQNVFTVNSASYDYDNFVDDAVKMFQYIPNSGYLTAQVGSSAFSFWNKVTSGSGFIGNTGVSIQTQTTNDGRFGYQYKELISPSGIIRLVWNPLLKNKYSGHMIMIDEGTVARVLFRNPMYQTAIHENDFDGQKDQYFSDEGLLVTNLKKNSLMKVV